MTTILSVGSTFAELKHAARQHGSTMALALAKDKLRDLEIYATQLIEEKASTSEIDSANDELMSAHADVADIENLIKEFRVRFEQNSLDRYRQLASKAHRILGLRTVYTPAGILGYVDPHTSIRVIMHRASKAMPAERSDVINIASYPSLVEEFAAQMHTNAQGKSTIHIYKIKNKK